MRSNQLNYTKNRSTKQELSELLLSQNVDSAYVSVSDIFGDYGIVGFYAIRDNHLIHFVFSCRTLGMQIEQYVYEKIGCPELIVMGEVINTLKKNYTPPWINQSSKKQSISIQSQSDDKKSISRILLKGPCDMSQMYAFLNSCKNIQTEFTYTNNDGILVEGHNHTSQIVTALYAPINIKNEIINEFSFLDQKMLDTKIIYETFDYIVLSMLTDGNLGVYRNKKNGFEIAFCEKKHDITNKDNLNKYIKNEIYTSGVSFTEDIINHFSNSYEFIDNNNGQITIQNLEKIWNFIKKDTKLILLLGSEHEFTKKCSLSYNNRHVEHRIMNDAIRKWAKEKNNVILLPFDKYIKSNNDFTDTINHFVKRVYYDLANDLIHIFNDNTKNNIKIKGKLSLYVQTILQKLRIFKKKLLKKIESRKKNY